MALHPYQIKIIDQFKTQELLLADLYRIFSERFVVDQVFWNRLTGEEQTHARLITKLYGAVEKGVVVFDEGKVKTYTLTAMIDRIQGLLQKARQGELGRAGAMVQAMDLESALIEKGVFTHFEALTETARVVLKKLNTETFDHLARVRQMYETVTRRAERPVSPSQPQTGNRLVWTADLSVGIPAIDAQHQLLFSLINDLADLHDTGGGREGLISLIQRMISFSDAHFAVEDEVMIGADFPLFISHRREHQRFLIQIGTFLDDYRQQRQSLTDDMMAFLKDWWFRHTRDADGKYARWIRNRQI